MNVLVGGVCVGVVLVGEFVGVVWLLVVLIPIIVAHTHMQVKHTYIRVPFPPHTQPIQQFYQSLPISTQQTPTPKYSVGI